jgi:hypothetical protein
LIIRSFCPDNEYNDVLRHICLDNSLSLIYKNCHGIDYAAIDAVDSKNLITSDMSTQKNRKLLDEVRQFMRLHHYSIHTERTYCDWIKKFVQFHRMKSRQDLSNGEKKIESFLTDLAVRGNVSASTQNQAMNALVFLYKKVLN